MNKNLFTKKGIIIGLILVLLASQVISFFFTSLDQWNFFYKFDQTYALENWNLPHNADIDIDGDGINDTITFSLCIFLSSTNPNKIPQNKICYISLKNRDKSKGYQILPSSKKLLNSYLARKGNVWYIVVNRVGEIRRYEINRDSIVVERDVPLLLQVDSLLYFLSHLFILFI